MTSVEMTSENWNLALCSLTSKPRSYSTSWKRVKLWGRVKMVENPENWGCDFDILPYIFLGWGLGHTKKSGLELEDPEYNLDHLGCTEFTEYELLTTCRPAMHDTILSHFNPAVGLQIKQPQKASQVKQAPFWACTQSAQILWDPYLAKRLLGTT